MKVLEIDENLYVNLTNVLLIKINTNMVMSQQEDITSELVQDGYKIEFVLSNNNVVHSKRFESHDDVKTWLHAHTKD